MHHQFFCDTIKFKKKSQYHVTSCLVSWVYRHTHSSSSDSSRRRCDNSSSSCIILMIINNEHSNLKKVFIF